MPRYREIDLYANEVEMNLKPKDTLGQFQEFYQEARMLQKTVTDCHILVGMEIEWIYDNTFAELQELIQQYPCDILVGSVQLDLINSVI